MITLYLNHFRGFEDTFIPLEDVSFLVGENSTGKTSVLTALRVLASIAPWLMGRFQVNDEVIGGFTDFASNGVPWFQVGYFRHEPVELDTYQSALLTFFGSGSRIPSVIDVRLRTQDREVRFNVAFGDLYCEVHRAEGGDHEEAFRRWTSADPLSNEGLPKLPTDHPNWGAPSGMLTTLYTAEVKEFEARMNAWTDRQKSRLESMFKEARAAQGVPVAAAPDTAPAEPPKHPESLSLHQMTWVPELRWLAPIRAKPKRSYDAVPQASSPEGDHIPWRLRSLSNRSKQRASIRDFGIKSGLYDDLETRKFGEGEDAPFELRVRLGDRSPNLVNVGYGVSQALPVVASIAEPAPGAWFALQQPEVHLHPKAQAALGELLFDSASSPQNKRFLVETHSDFVIDRFRQRMRKAAQAGEPSPRAQVLFFERASGKNIVHRMPLAPDGEYPEDQPPAFRAFFLEEEMKNLGY